MFLSVISCFRLRVRLCDFILLSILVLSLDFRISSTTFHSGSLRAAAQTEPDVSLVFHVGPYKEFSNCSLSKNSLTCHFECLLLLTSAAIQFGILAFLIFIVFFPSDFFFYWEGAMLFHLFDL